MERKGIVSHINKEDKYDFYGELTSFRSISEGLIRNIVKEGKWFSFCKVADKSQIDVMSILNNEGKKFGSMVVGTFESSAYRTAIYKYLLHDYMCYYESPIVKKEVNLNGFKNSYNKYIITSNINVVAEWLGISVEEADAQYGGRLIEADVDTGEPTYPYLKLYEAKNHERKVTRPRTDLDLEASGIRIVPVYALKAGVDALFEKLKSNTYDVKFLKDSGQVRIINTTFNKDKVVELYGDSQFVTSNFEKVYSGDFTSNPSFERGYIRVFELGASIYNNPTRSINFARIISFEEAEPDMSYMYIDLDSVLETFITAIHSRKWADGELEEMVTMLDEFEVGTERKMNNVRLGSVMQIENWANAQEMLLSTVFIRQLSLFMIGNPQWFNGYDGKPKLYNSDTEGNSSVESVGSLPTEIGDDFQLPLG